jgi:hypothetical protein
MLNLAGVRWSREQDTVEERTASLHCGEECHLTGSVNHMKIVIYPPINIDAP